MALLQFTRGRMEEGLSSGRTSMCQEAWHRPEGKAYGQLVGGSARPQGPGRAGRPQEAPGGSGAGGAPPTTSPWTQERPGRETRARKQVAEEGKKRGCAQGWLWLGPGGLGGRGTGVLATARFSSCPCTPPREAHGVPAFSSPSPSLCAWGLSCSLRALGALPTGLTWPLASPPQFHVASRGGPVLTTRLSLEDVAQPGTISARPCMVCSVLCQNVSPWEGAGRWRAPGGNRLQAVPSLGAEP